MLFVCGGVNVLRNEKVILKVGDFLFERIGFKYFFYVYIFVCSIVVIFRIVLIWIMSIGLGVISFVVFVEF